MKTDFPTASVGSSQAPTAAVEKSQSASNTEIQTLPTASVAGTGAHTAKACCLASVTVFGVASRFIFGSA
jgi:hypothetical protein